MSIAAHRKIRVVICVSAIALSASPSMAHINLELRPGTQNATVGDTVELGLYAVSDDPENSQLTAAMRVFFGWDPQYLQLLGLDQTGAVPLLSSGFPFPDPLYGVNESSPPQDGTGYYQALASLGNAVEATPGGTLITTFQFLALEPVQRTTVDILASAGNGNTVVYDGTIPNLDVTGTLGRADVTIRSTCPTDTNGDGTTNVTDLVNVILAWDTNGLQVRGVDADTNNDGTVNVIDLVNVILAWGECPGE